MRGIYIIICVLQVLYKSAEYEIPCDFIDSVLKRFCWFKLNPETFIVSTLEMLKIQKEKSLEIFIDFLKNNINMFMDYNWVNEEDIPVELLDLVFYWPDDALSFLKILTITFKGRNHIGMKIKSLDNLK